MVVKKLWGDYGVCGLILFLVGAYALFVLAENMMRKPSATESMDSTMPAVYSTAPAPAAAPAPMEPQAVQEGEMSTMYASVDPTWQSGGDGSVSSCSQFPPQNPADLLPKDTNSEWAKLNPTGAGNMSNVNLLKAGYHIGIDTIGQSLKNANMQIRSEPPNPQIPTGIWNQSTITPDFMRPPLEIGQGVQ